MLPVEIALPGLCAKGRKYPLDDVSTGSHGFSGPIRPVPVLNERRAQKRQLRRARAPGNFREPR